MSGPVGEEKGELTWVEGEVGPWTSIHLVGHCTTSHPCARQSTGRGQRRSAAISPSRVESRSNSRQSAHHSLAVRTLGTMQTLHGDAQLQPDSDRASMSTRAASLAAAGPDPPVDSPPPPAHAPAREQPDHFYPPQKGYMEPSIRSRRSSGKDPRRRRRPSPDVDGELFPPDPRPWPTRSLLYQYMPFRGMYHDVKRRLPFYFSDWYIAFLPQNWERVVGATIRMYFLKSVPVPSFPPKLDPPTDIA